MAFFIAKGEFCVDIYNLPITKKTGQFFAYVLLTNTGTDIFNPG